MDNITDMNKLKQYKVHHDYAKQYGDTDIQVYYFNQIKDLLAQEIYSEFGYDTCHNEEKKDILNKTIKLLQND
tara:strand:+ start:199 stop:417 length:219 start_codon:yes stop_codon:yes gene_type:complete